MDRVMKTISWGLWTSTSEWLGCSAGGLVFSMLDILVLGEGRTGVKGLGCSYRVAKRVREDGGEDVVGLGVETVVPGRWLEHVDISRREHHRHQNIARMA